MKCLITGAVILDIILTIDQLPPKGGDVYIQEEMTTIGGCALNVADMMHHFEEKFTLFAPLGKGSNANLIDAQLKKLGYGTAVHSNKKDNGYSLCFVESDGERTFMTLQGIEGEFEKEWFYKINPQDYTSIYISGYEVEGVGGESIIEFAKTHPKLDIYYAPGPRFSHISREKNDQLLSLSPVLHLNETEVKEYMQKENLVSAVKALGAITQNKIIVTLGEKGTLLYKNNELKMVETSPSHRVIDTIGAGDGHIGAYISMKQKGANDIEALKVANRVSRAVVETKSSLLTDKEFKNIAFNWRNYGKNEKFFC
ncbi:hypothetical protein CJ205_00030 [Dolosicoccus paucivorans]|uniref:Carbohydrate kinase PfkB domain-containing protein n=1 Tax=Dolosicoccus paucivorans TaxID=84521 RepID=A0A2N6SPZ0_9LACT|nr:PfkB family carbohydrate kinase [Dolosicoccus paucivorans]PMC59130.1 hypothetical protein CJ205_00030 [Dolosicoccus paucivorans]